MNGKGFYPLVLACIFGLVAGCSSATMDADMGKAYRNPPRWVVNFNPDRRPFSAVGTAVIGEAGFTAARSEAMADARKQLAEQIHLKIGNLAQNFVHKTGIGNDATVEKVVSHAAGQIRDTNFAGASMRSMWRSDKNELFILVTMEPESVKAIAREAIVSSYKDDNALWQQFQAKNALGKLEKSLRKM